MSMRITLSRFTMASYVINDANPEEYLNVGIKQNTKDKTKNPKTLNTDIFLFINAITFIFFRF